MTPSNFLLLDANVVIHLFKCGVWDKLISRVRLQIASTILLEAHFFLNDAGARVDFNLQTYVDAKQIDVVVASLGEVRSFLARFDPSYAEKLDPGEAESLSYLLSASVDTQICSADAIVFRVLGNLDRGEQGLSLEEVLQAVGLSRSLPQQFCRKFRTQYTSKGVEERLHGRGLKQK